MDMILINNVKYKNIYNNYKNKNKNVIKEYNSYNNINKRCVRVDKNLKR